MHSFLHSVGELLTPVLKDSNFPSTGRLTPEEFVRAGDFLVFKCPTWQWAKQPEVVRDFLPADKQYLVTRGVPSLKKITEERMSIDEQGDTTNINLQGDTVNEEEGLVIDLRNQTSIHSSSMSSDLNNIDEENIPDLETFMPGSDNIIPNPITDTTAVASSIQRQSSIIKTRTYDLYITYDKYWQTPRMWLTGYDEDGRPLNSQTIFEDISREHAHKTVTIETFPHIPSLSLPTIHPCKHASVMQSIVERSAIEVRVDQYLVVFLKWMTSVLPTINYDFTMSS